MNTLKEMERLHALGFAIHWIVSKQKRPVESKWTTGPRKTLKELRASYRPGYNIGVRTGTASKIGEHYLAVIDVDIKHPDFKKRALAKVAELTGDHKCPIVLSGSGNGSRHYYCLSKKPFKMITALKESGGEVCIYSEGRQMVLPPSMTKHQYKWVGEVTKEMKLPVLDFSDLETPIKGGAPNKKFDVKLDGFKPIDIELEYVNISDEVREKIVDGTGIEDRSAFLKTACETLLSAGLSKQEVLSVLTDKNNYIAKAALERKSGNRMKAAEWVYKYALEPMMKKRAPENMFDVYEMPTVRLTGERLKKQNDNIKKKLEKNWKRLLVYSGNGNIKNCMSNLVLILKKEIGEKFLIYDEFRLRETFGIKTPWGSKKGAIIDDAEISRIKYWVSKEFDFDPSTNSVHDAIAEISRQNSFNPVRDFLDDLEWDQKPRLGTWLEKYFEAEGEPEYLNQVFTKWMVAMVARVYQPGIKFDWMPIFEGIQGAGKSSFGRLLSGDKYFLDYLPNLAEKDAAHALQDIWICEMGELANLRKTDVEHAKAFITRTVDKFRPSHGRRLGEYPRHCVFFGTTNRETYLRDDTGNRRFKPVKVGKLDFTQLVQDREQLFAEAKHKFKTEFKNIWELELSGKAKTFEKVVHQQKLVEDESDAMREPMEDFIESVKKGDTTFDFNKFRISTLFEGVGTLGKWRPDTRNMMFAAKMLKKLGFEKYTIMGLNYWRNKELVGTFSSEVSTDDF